MAAIDSGIQEEITRAARLVEETIAALGINPDTARMHAPSGGQAWSLMRGSAAIAVFVRPPKPPEDSPVLRVVSPIIAVNPSTESKLYKHLLELNAAGMSSVAFGLHDGRVVAVSERPTRDIDPGEVRYIIQVVGAVADHYDDELIRVFGGQRISDRRT